MIALLKDERVKLLRPKSLVADAGLFLVLAIVLPAIVSVPLAAYGNAADATGVADDIAAAYYLALFVHVAVTLYDGSFDRLRTITWLLLILGWVIVQLVALAGYVIPWGQMRYWLASQFVNVLPEATLTWISTGGVPPVLAALLPIAVLLIDVGVMHRAWFKSSWLRLVTFAAAALGVGLAAAWGLNSAGPWFVPSDAPTDWGLATGDGPAMVIAYITVPWYFSPFDAMLRATPEKLPGVVVMFGVLVLPAIWPWLRADRLRSQRRTRWIWFACWLGFVVSFLGLGYLGLQAPEENVIAASQVLAIYCFAFLTLVPLVLAWLVPADAAG